MLGLLNKTAVLSKLSQGETVDLFGNAIRVHVQQFNGLGRRNDETTKQLKKAFSRKAMKASEGPAQTLSEQSKIDVAAVDALGFSADRAGLLVCGDPSVGLTMVLREDPNIVANRQDGTTDGILQAVRERADLKALLSWLLTDDFFRLRQRIGLSL